MSVNNKLVYIFKAYPGRWVGLIITNSLTQLSSVLRPITQDQRVRTRAFGVPVKTVTSRCQCWNPKLKKYEEAHWIEKTVTVTVAGLAPPGLIW